MSGPKRSRHPYVVGRESAPSSEGRRLDGPVRRACSGRISDAPSGWRAGICFQCEAASALWSCSLPITRGLFRRWTSNPRLNPAKSRRIPGHNHAETTTETVAVPSDTPNPTVSAFVLLSGRSRFDSWRGHFDHAINVTIPEHVAVSPDALAEALAAA